MNISLFDIAQSVRESVNQIDAETGEITRTAQPPARAALPAWPDDAFKTQSERWRKAVDAGLKSVDDILVMARTKGALTDQQEAAIKAMAKPADVTDVTPKQQPDTENAPTDDNGWTDFQNDNT